MVETNPTISELIKVIECCSSGTGCGVCIARNTPLCDEWVDKVANLIRNQQQEIERLREELAEEKKLYFDMQDVAVSRYMENCELIKQRNELINTVKDIWNDITSFYFSLRVVGNATVELDKLAEFWHKRGVEVE